jgi:NAD(P)-dependent dehydrogenase (short-subunit alcohol dehydrogenase family)
MVDRFALTGRTALVTGASSGLGHHFARTLARAGAAVAVAARRRDRLDELVATIAAAGGRRRGERRVRPTGPRSAPGTRRPPPRSARSTSSSTTRE